jgi:hypothetical protein
MLCLKSLNLGEFIITNQMFNQRKSEPEPLKENFSSLNLGDQEMYSKGRLSGNASKLRPEERSTINLFKHMMDAIDGKF